MLPPGRRPAGVGEVKGVRYLTFKSIFFLSFSPCFLSFFLSFFLKLLANICYDTRIPAYSSCFYAWLIAALPAISLFGLAYNWPLGPT